MKGYQQHEAFVADVRMYWKMAVYALGLGLVLQVAVFGYLAHRAWARQLVIPLADGRAFTIPARSVLKCLAPPPELFGRETRYEVEPPLRPFFQRAGVPDRRVTAGVYRAVMRRYFGDRIDGFTAGLGAALVGSCAAYLLSAVYFGIFFARARRMSDTRHVRGACRVPLAMLRRRLERDARAETDGQHHLSVCGLTLPRELETRHILIMGSTGTGKSVLVNQVIGQIIRRMDQGRTHERTIIYDVKGEFLAKHRRPGDLVFYPPDARCLRWSFFNECRTDEDIKVLSEIIFRPAKETSADPFWNNAAKAVFIAGLRFLHAQGCRTNADIWSFFAQNKAGLVKKIRELPLEQQGALKHIESDGSGPAQSVISVLTEKIDWFESLVDLDGDFSFRDYIAQPVNRNLFLLNIKNYADTFRPLMTFIFDLLIRETLSLPDTNPQERRRIWFCIDEIGSLNQIGVLLDLLTVARSKGGCLLVANQDLGKVEDVYGRANTRTFYNNFNTDIILRLNDPDTAEFVSRSIGDQQVIKVMGSRQMSPRDAGDRKSLSDQDRTERVMLPSEFMSIPDFRAIARVGGYGIATAAVPKAFCDVRQPHFIDRYVQAAADARRPQQEAPAEPDGDQAEHPAPVAAWGGIEPPRIDLSPAQPPEGGTSA